MAQMLVRGLEQEVLDRLEVKARRSGLSLEELARKSLREEAKPTRDETWAEIDRVREAGPRLSSDTATLIREARDGDDVGR